MEILKGKGSSKPNALKESMKLNWNSRGVRGLNPKKPSVGAGGGGG